MSKKNICITMDYEVWEKLRTMNINVSELLNEYAVAFTREKSNNTEILDREILIKEREILYPKFTEIQNKLGLIDENLKKIDESTKILALEKIKKLAEVEKMLKNCAFCGGSMDDELMIDYLPGVKIHKGCLSSENVTRFNQKLNRKTQDQPLDKP